HFWPSDPQKAALLAALFAFVLISGLAFQLIWQGKRLTRLVVLSGALGVVWSLVALWVWWQLPPAGVPYAGDGYRVATFVMAAILGVYILLPFARIYYETGRFSFPYTELFRHSWNMPFIVAIGVLFVGLYWTLVILWAELFRILGVSFFRDVFYSAPFVHITSYTTFGIGLAIGKESHGVINTLRSITLQVFRILMPLLAFIALLFLAALVFTGLQPLWGTRAASPLLLNLLVLSVLFINAVFQDGSGERPYPTWVRRGVEGMLITMPIFAGLILYSIGLRIQQYGFTPDRVYVVLAGIVFLLYGLGYAAAVLQRGTVWIGLIRPINIGVALFVVALAIAVHTPVLDPLGWSARNQYQRLIEGKVDATDFDYGALRFLMGRVGYAKLDALEKIEGHPNALLIRQQVAYTKEAKSYYATRERRPAGQSVPMNLTGRLEVLPKGAEAPEILLQAIVVKHRSGAETCMRVAGCLLYAINLDADPEPEYLLIPPLESYDAVAVFDQGAGGWENIGALVLRRGAWVKPVELIDKLRASEIELITPTYRDIRIGDSVYGVYGRER
ncbi:MAG: DUF4153 domain-containing protein, partial [Acidiferrobacterales bacterium]|nr:DUF4153 domain-containing protein [Acidiferrobacterales bacterium]